MARKVHTRVDEFMASVRASVHRSQMNFVTRRTEKLQAAIDEKLATFFGGMIEMGFGRAEGDAPPQLGVTWAPYRPSYRQWKRRKGYYSKGSFRARGRLQQTLRSPNLGANTFGKPKLDVKRISNTRIVASIHATPKAEGLTDYDLLNLLRTDQRIVKLGQRTGRQRPLFAPYFRWWFRAHVVPLIRNAYK